MEKNLAYLNDVLDEMAKHWPNNRTIQIVCHGHSVPSGYFATPFVNTFDAYPHLLHRIIKERFPFAVVNVIVTGIGGETSDAGSRRFEREVLNHNPDVITIDYGLNDRRIGLQAAADAWKSMIERALAQSRKVILLTPTWDMSYFSQNEDWKNLVAHRNQILDLAREYQVGLADSFGRFEEVVTSPERLVSLLSHGNHPSRLGHELVADEIAQYFPVR
ncbi:MAG: SGNH/GDSL hydrolase family protein [Candidatus Merdivicinus sp.]|jgi:acyl-CoA thioesterase-1